MSDERASIDEDDEPEPRPDWLDRIAYFMRPREAGRIVLVHSGSDARLGDLVRSLLVTAPDLRVLSRASSIWEAPERSAIVLVPTEEDAAWLNAMRPLFAERALRVVLWCDRATVGRLLVAAPDFMHWISHAVVGARGVPAFAVAGFRRALRARARGIAWSGPHLREAFTEALPGRRLRQISAIGTALERAHDVRELGPAWALWTEVDAEERVTLAVDALAIARRRTRAVLSDPAIVPAGFWPLHARTMPFGEACRSLEEAGAKSAGRLSALLDLEPEAVGLAADLLRSGVPEIVLEPGLLRASDPGAEVGRRTVEQRRARGEELGGLGAQSGSLDVGRAHLLLAPVLRATGALQARPGSRVDRTSGPGKERVLRSEHPFAEERWFAQAELGEEQGSGKKAAPGGLEAQQNWPALTTAEAAGRAVTLLSNEAAALHREGRFEEMLRAATNARRAAEHIQDVRLSIRAARMEGDALRLLGASSEALVRYSWILGIAQDPAREAEISSNEDAAFDVVSAHLSWVESALEVPSISTEQTLVVLDAGERFVQAIGRPLWRTGVLLHRARVLATLGRLEEAIAVGEEGLALALKAGPAANASVPSHRWALGHWMRRAGRIEEARELYEAVLADRTAHPGDVLAALRGLQECAQQDGDPKAARRFAEEAVRIAEPMGDSAMFRALTSLVDACMADGDLAAARVAADHAVRAASRGTDVSSLFVALSRSAVVAFEEGDLDLAAGLVEQMQSHAEVLDRARGTTIHQDGVADLRVRIGKAQVESQRDVHSGESGSGRAGMV